MTPLEQLIQQQVTASMVTRVSLATDKIAEELAQEILRDPVFRAEMQAMIRKAFGTTMGDLLAPREDVPPDQS
jgi:hypothetical protein